MTQPLQKLTRILTGLVLATILVASLNLPVSATNGRTEMTLSPAKVTPELKKGQTYKGEFSLYNTGEVDFKAKVYASPYEATNDGYKLQSTSDRSLLHKWVKFDKTEFEVKAKSSVQVHYTIEAPKDLPNGGQYGLIFAETINNTPTKTSGVAVTSRVGMLVYASTDGQNNFAGELHDVKIPFLNIGSKSEFSFKAKNSGNTHYNVNGEVTVKDLFGNNKFALQKNGITALPGVDKKVDFVWEQSPLFALMKVNLKGSGLDRKIDETRTVLFISPILIIIISVIILILGASYVANKKLKYRYKK